MRYFCFNIQYTYTDVRTNNFFRLFSYLELSFRFRSLKDKRLNAEKLLNGIFMDSPDLLKFWEPENTCGKKYSAYNIVHDVEELDECPGFEKKN